MSLGYSGVFRVDASESHTTAVSLGISPLHLPSSCVCHVLWRVSTTSPHATSRLWGTARSSSSSYHDEALRLHHTPYDTMKGEVAGCSQRSILDTRCVLLYDGTSKIRRKILVISRDWLLPQDICTPRKTNKPLGHTICPTRTVCLRSLQALLLAC